MANIELVLKNGSVYGVLDEKVHLSLPLHFDERFKYACDKVTNQSKTISFSVNGYQRYSIVYVDESNSLTILLLLAELEN